MALLIQGLKVIASLAIAWLGYVVLDPVRWAQLATPLSLSIPPSAYEMRIERLGVGSAILLLGVLCAISAVTTAAFPRRR